MIRERGMIFNSEMVRAIINGRKAQTRRPVKFPLIDKNAGCELSGNELAGELAAGNYWNSPFGQPGDRIWVRETWAEAGAGAPDLNLYRANYPEHVPAHYENVPQANEIRWTPSIHMPRWASRITLEITDVRVERLNDISESDANHEGVMFTDYGVGRFGQQRPGYSWKPTSHTDQCLPNARMAFANLWETIYGEYTWRVNPWVWVIEFKRVRFHHGLSFSR